jgi:hypothetical protein
MIAAIYDFWWLNQSPSNGGSLFGAGAMGFACGVNEWRRQGA